MNKTFFLSIAAVFSISLCNASFADHFDIIIRNGRIVDGSGNAWFYGSVGIKDGRIAGVGFLRGHEADQYIDAENRIVAPGFIDVHSHGDSGVEDIPTADNFVRDGVTTIVNGNCGGSKLDIAEYFAGLEKNGVGINVATLIGHNSVLRDVKGNKAGELDDAQWNQAEDIVAKAMQDGAMGMSTGLIYTPGTYSKTEEIIRLQHTVASYDGIYATHMRSEGLNILDAIDEAIRIGEETASRVEISHFKMPRTAEEKVGGSDVTLQRVYEARARGLEVWVDQYPYTASSTGISVLFPDWVLEEGGDKAKEILSDDDTKAKVKKDMAESHEVKLKKKDFDYAKIASADAYPEYSGLSIKEVAQIKKLEAEQNASINPKTVDKGSLPEVTMDDQYETIIDIYNKGGAGMVYHTMDESQVENIMKSPLVSVASDSGVREFNVGVPHPRGYGSNARVLGRFVREKGLITLEEAIRKMTSMPATAFRIKDRGLLREGNWADIVIFNPRTVVDNATFTDPHHYSTGFDYVFVNGTPVVEEDRVTGSLPGKPVYGPGYTP